MHKTIFGCLKCPPNECTLKKMIKNQSVLFVLYFVYINEI